MVEDISDEEFDRRDSTIQQAHMFQSIQDFDEENLERQNKPPEAAAVNQIHEVEYQEKKLLKNDRSKKSIQTLNNMPD
jgi:hypothetical protein